MPCNHLQQRMTTFPQKVVLKDYALIFWDFDGVIKDSVEVKSRAFESLFAPYGSTVITKVREHHQANGGMSRFEKFPIYLSWVGQPVTAKRVEEFCEQFSQRVVDEVIASAWVPGVECYLRTNPFNQKFVLISATPKPEIDTILDRLDLTICFDAVFGAPTSKQEAIRQTIARKSFGPAECLMIGDARADHDAATANDVRFLLRRHHLNNSVFADYIGPSIHDLTSL